MLASFKALSDGTIELWITNDTLTEVSDTIVVQTGSFIHGTLWKEQQQISVPAGSSLPVWRRNARQIDSAADHYLADEGTHFSDNYFDLLAGESRTITVSHPTNVLSRESVRIAWL